MIVEEILICKSKKKDLLVDKEIVSRIEGSLGGRYKAEVVSSGLILNQVRASGSSLIRLAFGDVIKYEPTTFGRVKVSFTRKGKVLKTIRARL